MKYEVTFSCGHTGTVQLYGKGDERERKIRYAVYQDVILSYKKYQAKPSCNGYCEKVYTAEDAEFARIQIEHLLKSCQ